MDIKKIVNGTKIESKNMIMVVTGKSDTAFLGYISYKGKAVGQISLSFEMFTNPHYAKDLKIVD
jgi:hypothetical protein